MERRWYGDDDDLPFNPRPGRVPEQELLLPELGFKEVATLWNFSGKNDWGSGVFRSEEVNRQKGVADRATRWLGGLQARPSLGRVHVAPGSCGHPP